MLADSPWPKDSSQSTSLAFSSPRIAAPPCQCCVSHVAEHCRSARTVTALRRYRGSSAGNPQPPGTASRKRRARFQRGRVSQERKLPLQGRLLSYRVVSSYTARAFASAFLSSRRATKNGFFLPQSSANGQDDSIRESDLPQGGEIGETRVPL